MEQRDRASGWQYAKLSGHKNEDLVKQLLDTDPHYAQNFLRRLERPWAKIQSTSVGGLHETNVPSVLGTRTTKSKTDLKVLLQNGETINLSVKKSLGGQVYLVQAETFIEVFERQFLQPIPRQVQRAIRLFWAAADDAVEILQQYGDQSPPSNYQLQLRHRSLNATTLRAYDETLYHALLQWFTDHACEITKLCFSMGAVQSPEEWSHYLWYINLLEEHSVDVLFSIYDIGVAAKRNADRETYYSPTNGGTTIRLPFGFVQWHQGRLQFHHDYDKIRDMLMDQAVCRLSKS